MVSICGAIMGFASPWREASATLAASHFRKNTIERRFGKMKHFLLISPTP
jgi:hypothetical protein